MASNENKSLGPRQPGRVVTPDRTEKKGGYPAGGEVALRPVPTRFPSRPATPKGEKSK